MPKSSEELRVELLELERRSAKLRMEAAQIAEQAERVKSEIAKRDIDHGDKVPASD